MNEKSTRASSPNLDRLRAKADALSRNAKLIRSSQHACFDEKVRKKAIQNPMAFLRSMGITVPPGLTVEFFEHPPRYLPFPDWTPFVFEQINCRTFWLVDCEGIPSVSPKCQLREVGVCFGFRIYPNPVQPGPLG